MKFLETRNSFLHTKLSGGFHSTASITQPPPPFDINDSGLCPAVAGHSTAAFPPVEPLRLPLARLTQTIFVHREDPAGAVLPFFWGWQRCSLWWHTPTGIEAPVPIPHSGTSRGISTK